MDESSKNKPTLTANGEKNLERFVNIDIYSSSNVKGIGGLYKYDFKDFIVKEITKERYTLEIKEDNLGSSFSIESKDRFTTFNLIKINKETFEAIKLISNVLNIPIDSIYYSGLKDKCSISVQKVSIKGNFIEKLRKLKLKDIFIRNIYPSRKSVKLGSNWGNQFIITIRNIEKSKNTLIKIKKIFKILQNQGFPNYFGLQRFGTFRPNSHLIGRFILESKFKEAFDEFVIKSYTSESMRSQKIRNELGKTGDLEKAYNDFPNSLNYEKIMIKYLIENPGDYKGAIYQLPDYLKKLLLSSFQSYLFNRMITMRNMKGFPLFKPKKGDVISILDDIDGQCTQITYKYGGNYDKYLKEALKLKRASIIFPLIGYDTDLDEFPLVKNLIKEIFRDEQINADIFDSDLLKDHEFKGAFRAITVKPIGLNLLEFTEDDIFQEKFKLKLEFSLQKGSYATMLLRELIK
ncbi:MAG: tRNA pseudouridine(13) synthase TruD [Candidatus Hermodarchaeota archaeon]